MKIKAKNLISQLKLIFIKDEEAKKLLFLLEEKAQELLASSSRLMNPDEQKSQSLDETFLKTQDFSQKKKNKAKKVSPADPIFPFVADEDWNKERDKHPAEYFIFTDGGASPNPGPGALAAFAQTKEEKKIFEVIHSEEQTSNNKMELKAAVLGLKNLDEYLRKEGKSFDERISLYSDSQYLVKGAMLWLNSWRRDNWKKSDLANKELWQELDAHKGRFSKLTFFWVEGHAGMIHNEYCDQLVTKAIGEIKRAIRKKEQEQTITSANEHNSDEKLN